MKGGENSSSNSNSSILYHERSLHNHGLHEAGAYNEALFHEGSSAVAILYNDTFFGKIMPKVRASGKKRCPRLLIDLYHLDPSRYPHEHAKAEELFRTRKIQRHLYYLRELLGEQKFILGMLLCAPETMKSEFYYALRAEDESLISLKEQEMDF